MISTENFDIEIPIFGIFPLLLFKYFHWHHSDYQYIKVVGFFFSYSSLIAKPEKTQRNNKDVKLKSYIMLAYSRNQDTFLP